MTTTCGSDQGKLWAHQVIVSRVEKRHEIRHDGDVNEETEGVQNFFDYIPATITFSGVQGTRTLKPRSTPEQSLYFGYA